MSLEMQAGVSYLLVKIYYPEDNIYALQIIKGEQQDKIYFSCMEDSYIKDT